MTSPSPVYLIDASIYIYRGWHLMSSQLVDRDNNPINAVIGFSDFLYSILSAQYPTHIACAFDNSRGRSVRHKIAPSYKANRSPISAHLKPQIARCQHFASQIGIPCFDSTAYEADDIIGTFSQQAQQANMAYVVVSADKDLAQLVSPTGKLWDYGRDIWLDWRGVRKKFGVTPRQIPDLLALCGDKVDNIPGIPGIGLSTGARLLAKWGTLENLYANLDKARNMRFRGAALACQLLPEHRQQVFNNRRLTETWRVPELPEITSLTRHTPSPATLETLFDTLSFDSIRRKQWSTHFYPDSKAND